MMKIRKVFIFCAAVVLGFVAPLQAGVFQCDVYFDGASEKTLTFGLGATAEEKPMPPDFTAVKYAWLQGSGNGGTVRTATDYTRLSTQIFQDADAATWTLNATSDIQMTFKGGVTGEDAYLRISEEGSSVPEYITDGKVLSVKAGETYCIQYGATRAVVPIPEAPEPVSVSYVTGVTSVNVTLKEPADDRFAIAIGMDSLKAFSSGGEERLCSLSQLSEDTWKVNITADTANFMFQYFYESEASGVRTQSALVSGEGTDMAFTLADVSTSSGISDIDKELRRVTVHPSDEPVKVTLSYTYVLANGLANPYVMVNTGTEAYEADSISATVNGEPVELIAQESPYEYKAELAAGEGTFSVSVDVNRDMVKHSIALLCGADGREPAQEATFDILVADFSLDFDWDDAITVDDANYLLNFRNDAPMLTYSTIGATEDDAAKAAETIAAYNGSKLDFDGNGVADVTDAIMFYNYMTLGGTGSPLLKSSLLIPDSVAAGTNPVQAFEYLKKSVPAKGSFASADGILSVKADSFILNVSDSAKIRVYAKSALPIQTLSFRMLLPEQYKAQSDLTVTMANISAETVKYFTVLSEDKTRTYVEINIVGAQGAMTIPADTETLIATIDMKVDSTGLKDGDFLPVTTDYTFGTRISAQNIELCEAKESVVAGGISVVQGVPATITVTTNPKTPISEVTGKVGSSVDAAFTAYLDTASQTVEELKKAVIKKIHWYVKDSAGSILAEAWVNDQGSWSDEACSVKQGKAVAGNWYVAGNKATVKNSLWTAKAKVTTAGFTTLNGVDRPASGAYTLTATVVDSIGNGTDQVWTIDVTDLDQLPAVPVLIQYSVNGGELVNKPGTILAGDSVVAYVKGKNGKEVVEAPSVDADGDAVSYYYAWYSTAKPADSDWKLAEDNGNILPPHGSGQTWKLEVKAFAKPEYAAGDDDSKYFSKSLKGASIKIGNTAPTANMVTRIADEECELTIDLVESGYVSDVDLPSDTLTFALANDKGKAVYELETKYGTAAIDKTTGILTYIGAGKKGTDTFSYMVTDKSRKSASAMVVLTLAEVNDPPYFTVNNFYLSKSEYAQEREVVIYAGRDYKDESTQKVTAATVALVNEADAGYFAVQPAVSVPAKGSNYQWLSTLSFTLNENTPFGIAIPCTMTATDSQQAVGTVNFTIVTGVTPWYPVHKAKFAEQCGDGITFKVKQVVNGVVQKKILATVSVPKMPDQSCVLTPELYYKANAKFTGLLSGETYYFEEYSYVLNKGKAKTDTKCIEGCTEAVEGTCETILPYGVPSADDITMSLVNVVQDKKGKKVYTYKVGAKLANSFVLKTLNDKGKPVKTIKQNFVNFDDDGQMVQSAELQLSFDKVVSVSVCGVNPAGTGGEKSFSAEELQEEIPVATRSEVEDLLSAWPSTWMDNSFFPKQGAVTFTEDAFQNVTFTWPVCASASSYDLAVYDAAGMLVAVESSLLSTADVQLAPGNYSWVVTAKEGGETAASHGNTFSIVDHTAEPVIMAVTTATGNELALKVINADAGEAVSFGLTYFDAATCVWTTSAVNGTVDSDGVVLVEDIVVFAETYITVQTADGVIANYVIRRK